MCEYVFPMVSKKSWPWPVYLYEGIQQSYVDTYLGTPHGTNVWRGKTGPDDLALSTHRVSVHIKTSPIHTW